MKQFWTVFKFELGQKLKEKSFIITMVITFLIVLGLTFLPRIIGGSGSQKDNTGTSDSKISENVDTKKIKAGVIYSGNVDSSVKEALANHYDLTEYKSEEELKDAVVNAKVDKGFKMIDSTNSIVYEAQQSFGEFNDKELQSILEKNFKYNIATKGSNVNPEFIRLIDETKITTYIESLGTNPFIGFILSYVLVFFLYFLILMHGQSIAMSVGKEKDNRTMELLVTNVRPKAMIWGKVMSGLSASIINILVIVLAIVIGYIINIQSNPVASSMVNELLREISFMDISVFLGFGLVGVTLYYLIYAALGSLISRMDELNQALVPVTMLVIIAFMVPMMTMSQGDTIILKVASFVPFTSPLAMFTRYQMVKVPLVEVMISFAILVFTMIVVGLIATKIYRNGTLNYGNRLNLWKAITSKSK